MVEAKGSVNISSGAVSRAVYIMKWAMSQWGLTAEQAAAFPGCMAAASDPTLSPGFMNGSAGRYGVAGWTSNRFTAAQASSTTLDAQLSHLASEISKMGDKPIVELKKWQHTQACAITVWNLVINGDRGGYESGTANYKSDNGAYVKYAGISYDAYTKGGVSTDGQGSCKGLYVDSLDKEVFNDPGEGGDDHEDEAKNTADPYSDLGTADSVQDDTDPVFDPNYKYSSPLVRLLGAESRDQVLGGSGQYLMRELGLTAVQAAGFIGCMMGESGQNLNPHAVNQQEKSGNAPNAARRAELRLYYGRGIGQWTWKSRAVDGWDRYLRSKGLSGPKPLEASGRELQLGYVVWETKNRPGFYNALRKCTNVYDAAVTCVRGFENGGPGLCSMAFLDKYTWAGGAAGFRRVRGGYACTAYKAITGKTYDVPDGGAYSPSNASSYYSGEAGMGDEEIIKKLSEEEKVYDNSDIYDKNVDWADLYGSVTASDEAYDALSMSSPDANAPSDELGDSFHKVSGKDSSEKEKESKLTNEEIAQQQNCETSGAFNPMRDAAIQTDGQDKGSGAGEAIDTAGNEYGI